MNQASHTEKQTQKRTMRGTVVRRSGDKTVAVSVVRVQPHPVYHKRIRASRLYLAHDPANSAAVGDEVVLQEHRPLSARKRWIIVYGA